MLPKFLIADNSQEELGKLFVVHTQEPRFILEGNDDDFSEDQVVHWIDEPKINETEVKELLAEAEDFLEVELTNQEDLYDRLVDENDLT
jgi:hypothetical protein